MFNDCGKLYLKIYYYKAGTVTFALAAMECQSGLLQKSYFSQKLSHKFREKSLCYFLMLYSANLGIFWIFSSFLFKKTCSVSLFHEYQAAFSKEKTQNLLFCVLLESHVKRLSRTFTLSFSVAWKIRLWTGHNQKLTLEKWMGSEIFH